jgi:hypothetical protein
MIVTAIGAALLLFCGLELIATTRDVVIAIRFAGGEDRASRYVSALGVEAALFDGIATLLLASAGGAMTRLRLGDPWQRDAAGLVVALAVLVGITAGFGINFR